MVAGPAGLERRYVSECQNSLRDEKYYVHVGSSQKRRDQKQLAVVESFEHVIADSLKERIGRAESIGQAWPVRGPWGIEVRVFDHRYLA